MSFCCPFYRAFKNDLSDSKLTHGVDSMSSVTSAYGKNFVGGAEHNLPE